MLSPELLKKVDSIFVKSSRKVTDVFVGEYESAFRGSGIEFEEFREYMPGDDIRQIDWHVTARMDKPFVKVFREEREQTIFLLVDASRSLSFGKNREKVEVATEIAALLAYAAIKSHDKVGLIIFSDRIEKYIAPDKGRGHVWNLIANLLSHKSSGKKTDINQAIQFFLKMVKRSTTCFLISDLLTDQYQDALRVANLRHEIVVLRILDAMEKCLSHNVLVDFLDLETDERIKADLRSQRKRAQTLGLHEKELKDYFCSHQIDYLDLLVDENYVDVLLKFFMKREKKR